MRGELAALTKPQVLFAAASGMVGFGGVFAMYSYIAPIVTDVTGLSRVDDPRLPARLRRSARSSAPGWPAGSPTGTSTARWWPAFLASIVMPGAVLPALAVRRPDRGSWCSSVGVLGSVLAINLQLRLMHAAGDAQMLGAALNHSALNIANGLGAWLGAVVIAGGYGYRAPSLLGAGLAVAGLVVFGLGMLVERRRVAAVLGREELALATAQRAEAVPAYSSSQQVVGHAVDEAAVPQAQRRGARGRRGRSRWPR